jgi:hypothetical protein
MLEYNAIWLANIVDFSLDGGASNELGELRACLVEIVTVTNCDSNETLEDSTKRD